jgi:hypothetical protein
MSAYPPPGPTVGQRIDEAVERIEKELRHAIGYVNDAVLPQVRQESISAMRTVADTLRTLADRMDASQTAANQDPPKTDDAKGPQA